MVENLLKSKGGNSYVVKGLCIKYVDISFKWISFFVAVFSNMILFASFTTAAKFNTFTIFLTFDL